MVTENIEVFTQSSIRLGKYFIYTLMTLAHTSFMSIEDLKE